MVKVRPGILFSSVAHAALLTYAIVGLSSAKPFDVGPTEALPIEILTPQEFDAMTKGSKTSKKVDAPKQKAEQVAAVDSDPVDDDTPIAKEDVKAPPPPPPAAEAPPVPDPAKAAAEKAAEAQKAADAEKAEKAKEAAKAAQEKAVAEKAEAAKAAQEKAAAEKAEKVAQAEAAELRAKAEADKAAKEKAETEKAAAAKAAKEKAEAEKLAKAEAEKAAKEKAEKLAKAEAAKAAKEKAEAEKAAKAAERKFDPSKIASLLGDKASSSDSALKDVRDPGRKAVAARETAPETTAGTSRGTATKLSMSERTGIDNAVREQVMQCWNPPIGAADDGSLAVRIKFTLNADGTLSDGPTVVNSSSNPAFRAAAGAATRAVQRCAPLKLPAESYDYWRQVNINFDPKDMMGG